MIPEADDWADYIAEMGACILVDGVLVDGVLDGVSYSVTHFANALSGEIDTGQEDW